MSVRRLSRHGRYSVWFALQRYVFKDNFYTKLVSFCFSVSQTNPARNGLAPAGASRFRPSPGRSIRSSRGAAARQAWPAMIHSHPADASRFRPSRGRSIRSGRVQRRKKGIPQDSPNDNAVSDLLRKCRFYGRGDLVVCRLCVDLRRRYVRMSQYLLHDVRRNAHALQQGCRRAPCRVERNALRYAGGGAELAYAVRHVRAEFEISVVDTFSDAVF